MTREVGFIIYIYIYLFVLYQCYRPHKLGNFVSSIWRIYKRKLIQFSFFWHKCEEQFLPVFFVLPYDVFLSPVSFLKAGWQFSASQDYHFVSHLPWTNICQEAVQTFGHWLEEGTKEMFALYSHNKGTSVTHALMQHHRKLWLPKWFKD